MADEDRFTRITLRIPREVHSRLSVAAEQRSHSMNAEIVQRLEDSFVNRQPDDLINLLYGVSERCFFAAQLGVSVEEDVVRTDSIEDIQLARFYSVAVETLEIIRKVCLSIIHAGHISEENIATLLTPMEKVATQSFVRLQESLDRLEDRLREDIRHTAQYPSGTVKPTRRKHDI